MNNLVDGIQWEATIGDPTLMGWLTVLAYFLTSVVAFRLYLTSQSLFSADVVKTQKAFWLVVALTMLALGVNKQLDLQSLFTAIGKYYALRDGWYEVRGGIQTAVISGLLVLLSILFLMFVYRMKSILRTNWLAISGLVLLLVFISVRAASFHHMVGFNDTYYFGVKINAILELSGVMAIALSAVTLRLSRSRSKNKPG